MFESKNNANRDLIDASFKAYTGDEIEAEKLFSRYNLSFKRDKFPSQVTSTYLVSGKQKDYDDCRYEYDLTDGERRAKFVVSNNSTQTQVVNTQ